MTTIDLRIVSCPNCHTKQNVKVYGSITANKDQHLKQKILDGTFFQQECASCHKAYMLTNDILYNDTEKKQALWLSQFPIDKRMEDAFDSFSFLTSKGYCKRLAYNSDEFREKVIIFSTGFNDLYVHMLKFSLAKKNNIPTTDLLFSDITKCANNGIEIRFYMLKSNQYITMSNVDNPYGLSAKWDNIEQYLDWIHVDDNNFVELISRYGHMLS